MERCGAGERSLGLGCLLTKPFCVALLSTTCSLSLMAAALLASLVSRWMSVPIYHRLAQAQLARLPADTAEPTSPPSRA